MRITSTRRGRKGSRRLPTNEIRELLKDGRVWCRKAKVIEPDGHPHFYIHTDQATGARSVMIEVMTVPEGEDLTCKLSTRPLWYIPPPGTIVYVGVPSGEIDHCPEVVGISDSGAADENISTDRTLLATEVELVLQAPAVKLGGVDADEPLVLGNQWKDFAQAILEAIAAHTHTSASPGSPTTPPLNALDFTQQIAQLAGKLSQAVKTK